MDRLDFVSLHLFASVAENGNIAQAARVNNIAASAISKRISDLEERLGVPLIRRLRDGVEATDAGEALWRHVRGVSDALSLLQAELSEFATGARGRIRLWANTSALTQFLPEDLKTYLDTRPDVGIDLREEVSVAIVEAVRDGVADIGIFSGHLEVCDLTTRVYRRDTMMVIVPVGHPLAGRERVTLSETAPFDHVGLQAGSSLQERILTAARLQKAEIRMRVQVLSFDGVRRMVEAGLGVAILPQGTVLPYLDSGIAAIPLDEPCAARTLYVTFRDYRSLPVIARELLDLLAPVEPVHPQEKDRAAAPS